VATTMAEDRAEPAGDEAPGPDGGGPRRGRGVAGAARTVDAFITNPNVKFGQWCAFATLAFFLFTQFLFQAPGAILFQGAVLGSLSALIAVGIVLVYRANRIINFAQGDLGAVAGVLSVSLIVGWKWPFWPALFAGLVAGVVLGGLVEFLFIRRFSKAPRLILTVATIGISQILAGLQLIVPRWFGYNVSPQNFPTPFDFSFEWSPLIFRGSHLLVVITVPVIAVGLVLFFNRTRTGKAVRAAAESEDRALLLGIPVKRIGTYVWVLAAVLSALAAVLRAPIVGVPIGETLGPSLMLRALAAAVIGRMENLTVTFGAAVAIGMVEQAVFWDQGRDAWVDPVVFGLIMIAMLVQSRGIVSRAVERGQATWSSIREVRPIPPELAGIPVIQGVMRATKVLVIGLLVVVPLGLGPGRVNLMAFGVLTAILALSLVILTGWAGQISLGQWAFAGFGAAVAGTMVQHEWNFLVAIATGAFVGAAVAVVIGVPALRIKGLFLAVATLAFSLAAGKFFLNREFFGYVPQDRIPRPTIFGKWDLESEYAFYYVCLIALGLVLISLRSLRNSRTGRVLLGVRENERAVQAFGVNLVRAKLTAFALSGFFAALMGGLLALHQHSMLGSQLAPENNFRLFSLAVVGGLGSPVGVLAAAALFTGIDYFVTLPAIKLFTTGAGLLVVLMVFPGGIGGIIYDLRDIALRRFARRRGIHVPSLVADQRVEDADGSPTEDEPTVEEMLLAEAAEIGEATDVITGREPAGADR
jgi:branched-chain amino acid transport system permease protein